MGSWSVYCGISQIAITSGQKCVLLPLKESMGEYLPYLPATLPIFGEYDDYGGIENIEKDENTKLIEEHFDCTIEEFCTFFTRGCIRDDEDDFPKKLKKVKEIKKWKFMLIERQVYDFMSSYVSSDYKGHLEFGNPKILEMLGFTFVGESTDHKSWDPKRFNKVWKFGDKTFFGDGTWIHGENDENVYWFNDRHSVYEEKDSCALRTHVDIPEDKLWMGEKSMVQLWEHFDEQKQCELLGWILGIDRFDRAPWNNYKIDVEAMLKLAPGMDIEFIKKMAEEEKIQRLSITNKYSENLKVIGNRLCELVTIRQNLHPMSGWFSPHQLYVTPQCGEYTEHQIIIDKFSQINKSYIQEEEE